MIDFKGGREEKTDLATMSREELHDALREIRERIADLDGREPADMDSEEYEVWGDAHENLEDRADEILDRLDELK